LLRVDSEPRNDKTKFIVFTNTVSAACFGSNGKKEEFASRDRPISNGPYKRNMTVHEMIVQNLPYKYKLSSASADTIQAYRVFWRTDAPNRVQSPVS